MAKRGFICVQNSGGYRLQKRKKKIMRKIYPDRSLCIELHVNSAGTHKYNK